MKSFSRSSLALLSGLVAASVLGMAGEVKAQSVTTGTTQIDVNVKGILEIVSTPDNQQYGNDTGDTAPPTAAATTIGELNVRSNKKNGFTISVSSTTDGELVAVDTNGDAITDITDSLAYKVNATDGSTTGGATAVTSGDNTFEAAVQPPSGGSTIVTSADFATLKCAANAGCNIGIQLQITGNLDSVPEGTYSDELTYTIAAQ